MRELQGVTCHMGYATCHQTQENTPTLTLASAASKAGTRFTYHGGMEG